MMGSVHEIRDDRISIAVDESAAAAAPEQAQAWMAKWEALGGGVTIGAAGTLHPWIFGEDHAEAATYLLEHLRTATGLPRAVRDDIEHRGDNWRQHLRAYAAAFGSANEFYRTIWEPHSETEERDGTPIPEAIEAEMDRLDGARHAFEDRLLAVPSITIEQVLTKFVICFAEDRELTSMADQLVAEALALLPERYSFLSAESGRSPAAQTVAGAPDGRRSGGIPAGVLVGGLLVPRGGASMGGRP